MNDMTTAVPSVEFKDRRTGLMVFGILLILLGVYMAFMVPIMLAMQLLAGRVPGVDPTPLSSMLSIIGMYMGMAALFITLGIGSIRCRRWARALVLVMGWIWLIGGIAGMIAMCFILPQIFSGAMPGTPPGATPPPHAVLVVMMIFSLGIGLVTYVLIPGALVLFYRSPHVKATCEARHRKPCWTDACPLPVLAISLMLGGGALMIPMVMAGYHSIVPFFGRYISGMPGAALLLVTGILYAWGARACYKLQPAGWWIAVAGFTFWIASAVVTFARVGVLQMYEAMELPKQQLEVMRQMKFLDGPWLWVAMLLAWVPFIGYVIYTKKYFKR